MYIFFAWFFSFSLGDNEVITRKVKKPPAYKIKKSKPLGPHLRRRECLAWSMSHAPGPKALHPTIRTTFLRSSMKLLLVLGEMAPCVCCVFFFGGGCLSLYEYVWAICWVVWVAQVERIDGKQELRRTYGVSDQSDLGQPVQELLSQNERPHPPTL